MPAPTFESCRRFARITSVLLLTLAHPGGAGVQQWSLLGPYGADVSSIVADPDDPSSLLLLGRQGLFRSADGGASWARSPPDSFASGVTQLAAGPSVFYLSLFRSEEPGPALWRSVDGGASWSAVPGELTTSASWRIMAADPADPAILYAASREILPSRELGVFKSTDSGLTWSSINAGLEDYIRAEKLILAPDDPSVVLLVARRPDSRDSKLFRSADGGQTWEAISDTFPPTPGLNRADVFADIAVDPRDSSNIYAAVRQHSGAPDELYRSVDGGESWRLLPEAIGIDCRDQVLAVAPVGAPTVYLANSCQFLRSEDGGENWSPFADGIEGARVTTLTVDPLAPSTLYAGIVTAGETLGGVLRSTDSGASWAPRQQGLGPFTVVDLVLDPHDPNKIYASINAHSYAILRSADGGETWDVTFTSSWFPFEHLEIDPEDSSILHAAMDTRGGGILRTADGGETWSWPFADLFIFPQTLAVDPAVPDFVYSGTNNGFLRSLDRGQSWQEVDVDFDNVQALTVDPATRDVYAATFTALHRSSDQGATWTQLAENPAWRIHSLAVDPSTPANLYLGTWEPGVLRSRDGGLTWSASDDVDRSVEALVIDPTRPSVVYAGTRGGVHRSTDGGRSWALLGEESPWAWSLVLDPADPNVVYAAGTGISRIEVVDTTLALQDGRFEIEIEWTDFRDRRGPGRVVVVPAEERREVDLRSPDSTVLQFFSPDNWELLFKVLDGRAINGHFWVFFAAATDVGYTVTVTDTSCGETESYVNPLGLAARAVTDESAFAPCGEPLPPSCNADEDTFCMGEGGRFEVEVEWTNFQGATGTARQARLPEAGLAASGDTGLFYFFSENNWELLVKVLDGCDVNGHFWLFGAATTDVGYRLKVTDVATGVARTLINPVGLASPAITDTRAFPTCDL